MGVVLGAQLHCADARVGRHQPRVHDGAPVRVCWLQQVRAAAAGARGGAARTHACRSAAAAVRRLWEGSGLWEAQRALCTDIRSRARACGVRPRIGVQQRHHSPVRRHAAVLQEGHRSGLPPRESLRFPARRPDARECARAPRFGAAVAAQRAPLQHACGGCACAGAQALGRRGSPAPLRILSLPCSSGDCVRRLTIPPAAAPCLLAGWRSLLPCRAACTICRTRTALATSTRPGTRPVKHQGLPMLS